jgi:hypothetical protein
MVVRPFAVDIQVFSCFVSFAQRTPVIVRTMVSSREPHRAST